jgi:hypothetical protein
MTADKDVRLLKLPAIDTEGVVGADTEPCAKLCVMPPEKAGRRGDEVDEVAAPGTECKTFLNKCPRLTLDVEEEEGLDAADDFVHVFKIRTAASYTSSVDLARASKGGRNVRASSASPAAAPKEEIDSYTDARCTKTMAIERAKGLVCCESSCKE